MRTLPYAWYTDPDVLAAERRSLFAPAWHYAGELRAFVNVCRHRGAEVVSGAGRCTTLGEGQFHLVWPGLKVNVMPGPPNLSIGPVWPVSPARTEGFLDHVFAPDADVQHGVASGALDAGELLLPAESLIAAFQRWVSDALPREPQLPGA